MSVAIFFVHRGGFLVLCLEFSFYCLISILLLLYVAHGEALQIGVFFIVLSQGMHALEGGSKVGQWSISL